MASCTAAKMGTRRGVLATLAPKFGLTVLGLVAAYVAVERYVPGDNVPSRRKLYVYEEGVCDGYIESNYFYPVVVLLCWGIFYMFWALSIVCDDYFVASLEEISEALGLSPDVAGATFMAAGSSAPELFTSLMGVFAVKNDVGVGTIVGSAVFNLCCIIGGTAIFTPTVLVIDWKPITRDSFFYGCSIAGMIWVLSDGKVTTVEAASLMVGYVVYVLCMAANRHVMAAIDRCCGANPAQKLVDEYEYDGKKPGDEEEEESGPIATAIALPLSSMFRVSIPNCTEPGKKGMCAHFLHPFAPSHEMHAVPLIALPLLRIIPRAICMRRPPGHLNMHAHRSVIRYVITFIMSILWIGVLSYLMVAWASKLGCLFGIHPAIMGCTILAAGTSVPDAIGSLIVAREGQGDMAVSNAIGSNVFDILLGLGLPWTLNGLIYGTELNVDAQNLVPLSFILVGTLIGVYIVTLASNFTLTKTVGGIFFFFYLVFVAYNLAHEFKMIPF